MPQLPDPQLLFRGRKGRLEVLSVLGDGLPPDLGAEDSEPDTPVVVDESRDPAGEVPPPDVQPKPAKRKPKPEPVPVIEPKYEPDVPARESVPAPSEPVPMYRPRRM